MSLPIVLTAAAASAPAAASGDATAGFIANVLPLVLIFIVFYFLLIRPQQRRMKQHQAKVAGIVRGDTVVTNGGIVGKVTGIDDVYVQVEIAKGTTVKVVRGMLSDVVPAGTTPAND